MQLWQPMLGVFNVLDVESQIIRHFVLSIQLKNTQLFPKHLMCECVVGVKQVEPHSFNASPSNKCHVMISSAPSVFQIFLPQIFCYFYSDAKLL
jgi:hypothetical protein